MTAVSLLRAAAAARSPPRCAQSGWWGDEFLGAAAAQALYGHFLANADSGNHAANDEFVTELLRRIRARQH